MVVLFPAPLTPTTMTTSRSPPMATLRRWSPARTAAISSARTCAGSSSERYRSFTRCTIADAARGELGFLRGGTSLLGLLDGGAGDGSAAPADHDDGADRHEQHEDDDDRDDHCHGFETS